MLRNRAFISSVLFLILLLTSILFLKDVFHSLDQPKQYLIFNNPGKRQGHLLYAVNAYNERGISLIRYVEFIDKDSTEKKATFPMETAGDDLGMYYVIPFVSHFLNISSKTAYQVFFITFILLGFILASIGFHLLFQHLLSFVMSQLILFFLAMYTMYILDVYSVVFICVSTVPLLLYFLRSKHVFLGILFLMFSGVLFGWANLFRNHSGTGMAIFVLTSILLQPKGFSMIKKIALSALLITFTILPYIFIHREMKQRNQQLLAEGFDARMFEGFNTSHIIWHSIYLGLGYKKDNPYGIKWSDTYGYSTAREIIKAKQLQNIPRINPVSMPAKYEEIIQDTFFEIARKDPSFVLSVWMLKLWHVLKTWVWFFKYGIYFAVFCPLF